MRQFYVKRRRPKHRIDYFDYINSSLWTDRKERYYQKHKRQCQACGSFKTIQLHHLVYGQFGNEPDANLVSLCSICHQELHKQHLSQKDIREQTKTFIDNKQKTIRSLKILDKKLGISV